jgi:hypothetical protein
MNQLDDAMTKAYVEINENQGEEPDFERFNKTITNTEDKEVSKIPEDI